MDFLYKLLILIGVVIVFSFAIRLKDALRPRRKITVRKKRVTKDEVAEAYSKLGIKVSENLAAFYTEPLEMFDLQDCQGSKWFVDFVIFPSEFEKWQRISRVDGIPLAVTHGKDIYFLRANRKVCLRRAGSEMPVAESLDQFVQFAKVLPPED